MTDVQVVDGYPPIITVTELRVFTTPWDGTQQSCAAITKAFTQHASEWGARMITARNQARISMIDGSNRDSRFVVEFERVVDKRVLGAEVAPGELLALTVSGYTLLKVEAMPAPGIVLPTFRIQPKITD